jgi:hypothetical protein
LSKQTSASLWRARQCGIASNSFNLILDVCLFHKTFISFSFFKNTFHKEQLTLNLILSLNGISFLCDLDKGIVYLDSSFIKQEDLK